MFIQLSDANFERYDVLIAGSGPAGTVLAKKLAETGKSVLIIETGNSDYDALVQDAYAVVHGRGHYDSAHWPSHWTRALGGTSALWTGWVAAPRERNFASWPVSWAELNPWLEDAAVELRRNPVICDWRQAFLPGFQYQPFSIEEPVRYGEDFAEGYAQSELIHVLLRSTVSRLYPRPDRSGVAALTIFSEPDQEVEVRLRQGQSVVLAAGGMGNPQVLLASKDSSSAAVGNESDQVGRYLMEHPHMYGCARFILSRNVSMPEVPPDFGAFEPAIVPDDATFDEMGGIDASFQLVPSDLDLGDSIEQMVISRIGADAQAFDVSVRSEMLANAENRVVRAPGSDPAGLPRLRATCVIGGDEFRAVTDYLQRLGEDLAREDIGRVRIINSAIIRGVSGGGHTMGTTRMGDDPRSSVTDRDCRVHGYENLYIAGSSLFPNGGYANPTLIIVALAARLGAHLAGRS